MNDVRNGKILEIAEPDRYFFDKNVSYRPRDTKLLTAFLFEEECSHPSRMVFTSIIEIDLLLKLIFVESIDFMLLNMEVAVGFVLPECHLI